MTVTVFTNPSNPQCEATEQELTRLGVRYVAVDLTQNPSTFEQIKDAGFKQIPVVISRTHHGAATSRTRSVSSRRISQPESHFDASCPSGLPD